MLTFGPLQKGQLQGQSSNLPGKMKKSCFGFFQPLLTRNTISAQIAAGIFLVPLHHPWIEGGKYLGWGQLCLLQPKSWPGSRAFLTSSNLARYTFVVQLPILLSLWQQCGINWSLQVWGEFCICPYTMGHNTGCFLWVGYINRPDLCWRSDGLLRI